MKARNHTIAFPKMDISETLRKLEVQLQTGSVRKDAAAVSSMLTEDFKEFGSSGHIFSKSEIIRALQSESPAQVSMQDFQANLLAEKIAFVTYRSIKNQPGCPTIESLRSSLWIFQDGRWQMHFHQGTRVPATP
jgi:hypothetical protein